MLQNTFILIELEGKVPLDAYTSWANKTERLKATSVILNLENFTTYYEKLINQQAGAIYIRQT